MPPGVRTCSRLEEGTYCGGEGGGGLRMEPKKSPPLPAPCVLSRPHTPLRISQSLSCDRTPSPVRRSMPPLCAALPSERSVARAPPALPGSCPMPPRCGSVLVPPGALCPVAAQGIVVGTANPFAGPTAPASHGPTGRLLSVTNAIEAGTWRQGGSGWAYAGRPGGGGGVPMHPCPPHPQMRGRIPQQQDTLRTRGGRPHGSVEVQGTARLIEARLPGASTASQPGRATQCARKQDPGPSAGVRNGMSPSAHRGSWCC